MLFRSFFCAVMAGLVLGGLWVSPASVSAGPPEEMLGPLREKLNQKITLQVESTGARAVEKLSEVSGIPMRMDRSVEGAGGLARLEVEDVTVYEALERLTNTGDLVALDWGVQNGVVIVGTKRKIAEMYMETRVYDVRALTMAIPRFPGKDLELQRTPHERADQSSGGGGSGGQGLFAASGVGGRETDVAGIGTEGLANLIRESLEPDTWRANGGLFKSLQINNGVMTVSAPSPDQRRIEELLRRLHISYGKMVSVQAEFLAISRSEVTRVLGEASGGILSPERVERFRDRVGEEAKSFVLPLATMRSTCMNAQVVTMTAGEEQSFVKSFEPVVGTGVSGLDPEVGAILSGMVLELQPAASFDDSFINLRIRGTLSSADLERGSGFLTGGTSDAREQGGETGGSGKRGATPNSLAGVQFAEVTTPDNELMTFRTMVTLPDEGAVLLSGSSSALDRLVEDAAFNDRDSIRHLELALLIRVRIVPSAAAKSAEPGADDEPAADESAKQGGANQGG